MKIDINNGQFFYDLFYRFSFLLVLIIYLLEGYKRKFPWSTWLLVIVTVRIFFITGSKFGAITQDDFSYFIHHFQFPVQYNTNLIGALVFGFIGVGFAKLLLQIKYPVLDAFAIAVPFGMAVQRVGCLIVGCCYGTETHIPWGIRYGVHAPAYFHQLLSHQISSTDTLTHTIHPVPLYFIISCLIIGITVILLRHHFKRQGNLALFSLMLISACRFIIEFFRDPQSNGSFQGNYFMGLKIVQIFSLLTVCILFAMIIIRERQFDQKTFAILPNHPLLNSSYLLMLSVVLYVTRNWFSDMEFQVLLITLIPAAVSVVNHLLTTYFTNRIRISTIFLLLLSLIIMSQTNPQRNSTSYQTIRVGYSGGNYYNYHDIGTGSGCDRQSMSQTFNQNYKLGGAGYSIVKKDSLKMFEYGLNGYIGMKTETGLTSGVKQNNPIWGINPFMRVDYKWVGAGIGLNAGKLLTTPGDWVEEKAQLLPQTATMSNFIYPQLYARVGIERYLFLGYHLGDHFPAPFPIFYNYLELGSGFGFRNGLKLSYGTNLEGGMLLKGEIPIRNRFILEPVYQQRTDYYTGKYDNYQFSVGVRYLFGFHHQ